MEGPQRKMTSPDGYLAVAEGGAAQTLAALTSDALRLSFHFPTLTCLFWIDRGRRSDDLDEFIKDFCDLDAVALGKAHACDGLNSPSFHESQTGILVEELVEKSTAEQLGQFWLVGRGTRCSSLPTFRY